MTTGSKDFIFRLKIEELKEEIRQLKEENKNLNFMVEKQLNYSINKIKEDRQNKNKIN